MWIVMSPPVVRETVSSVGAALSAGAVVSPDDGAAVSADAVVSPDGAALVLALLLSLPHEATNRLAAVNSAATWIFFITRSSPLLVEVRCDGRGASTVTNYSVTFPMRLSAAVRNRERSRSQRGGRPQQEMERSINIASCG
jgi:hypothetical protein